MTSVPPVKGSVVTSTTVSDAIAALPARWTSDQNWQEAVKNGLQEILNAMIAEVQGDSPLSSPLAKKFQEYLMFMLEEQRDSAKGCYATIYEIRPTPWNYEFKFFYDSTDNPDLWIQIRAQPYSDETFHFSFWAGYASFLDVVHVPTRYFTDAEAKKVEARAKEAAKKPDPSVLPDWKSGSTPSEATKTHSHADTGPQAPGSPTALEWDFCSTAPESVKIASDVESVGGTNNRSGSPASVGSVTSALSKHAL